eukprot:1790597-Rhodomonas_salina.3
MTGWYRWYYGPSTHIMIPGPVTGTVSCASNKPRNHSHAGLAQPIPIPELPWASVGIDFVCPLPMSCSSNNKMITFTNCLSCTFRTVPFRCDDVEQFPASSLAEAYFVQIFRYHGFP